MQPDATKESLTEYLHLDKVANLIGDMRMSHTGVFLHDSGKLSHVQYNGIRHLSIWSLLTDVRRNESDSDKKESE